jgi:hypothetical protein
MSEQHFRKSAAREKIVEHVFAARLLQYAWSIDADLEVLRSEVDAAGYDLVLEANSVVRHVQLKATVVGGRRAQVDVHVRLCEKPSGCIVWLDVTERELEIVGLRWFGGNPGQPLPPVSQFRVAKHTKANTQGIKTERPDKRQIPRSAFRSVSDIKSLFVCLFGEFTQDPTI